MSAWAAKEDVDPCRGRGTSPRRSWRSCGPGGRDGGAGNEPGGSHPLDRGRGGRGVRRHRFEAAPSDHRWRDEFGGLKLDPVRRLKELERENLRLRRAVSDLTLDELILQEAARGTEGPRSETDEPRAPQLRRWPGFAGCSASPSAGRAAPWADPARREPPFAAGVRRRGTAHGRHRRAGYHLWAPSLPPDHRAAPTGGVGGEQEAGGAASLRPPSVRGRWRAAARGAHAATETAEAGPALAGLWVVRAASARAARPRLAPRLRPGQDA